MENLFVPFILAEILKTKGFDLECIAYWARIDPLIYEYKIHWHPSGITYKNIKETSILSPTYQQVIDWLRTKGITLWTTPSSSKLDRFKGHYMKKFLAHYTTFNVQDEDEFYRILNTTIREALKLI